METQCADCGTVNYEGARYCRKCGRTLIDFAVSEATTRSFDEREHSQRPYAEPGEPARYVPPSEATPPGGLAPPTGFRPAAGTNPLASKPSQPWAVWVVLVIAIVVIAAVGAAFLAMRVRPGASISQAPTAPPAQPATPRPEAPVVAEDPDPDLEEIAPPVEGDEEHPGLADVPERARRWVYPGASVDGVTEPPGGRGQVILQLSTGDDVAKVVSFYRERFKGRNDVTKHTEPGEASFIAPDVIVSVEDGGSDDGRTGINVVMNPGGGGMIPPIVVPPVSVPPIPPPPPPAPAPR
jgi:hypothetical protein